jgi:hypothetical protein
MPPPPFLLTQFILRSVSAFVMGSAISHSAGAHALSILISSRSLDFIAGAGKVLDRIWRSRSCTDFSAGVQTAKESVFLKRDFYNGGETAKPCGFALYDEGSSHERH